MKHYWNKLLGYYVKSYSRPSLWDGLVLYVTLDRLTMGELFYSFLKPVHCIVNRTVP